ncbi:hypothetical protein BD626DRAFT_570781 [Schizophyllum amplum]|uniref:Phosphatidate phosphatase APP1 catalytic domain-containing protein n=1 Tax=Schizophyllum amplum TaxID=97359 RepID=A0A550C9U9_9AGAR|nr:hypothetical protein BD626DRAFT_570781 [Auriculariopsis ampla]
MGILPGLDIPSLENIREQAGLSSAQIAQLPVRILNVPGYANLTDDGWNVLFHGQAYRQPLDNSSRLDRLASGFLRGKVLSALHPSQQEQARNLTSAIYSLPVAGLPITMTVYNATGNDSPVVNVSLPFPTDVRGEFNDFWVNTSIFLVPREGITFLADVDDVLRETRIFVPSAGLLDNSFVHPFTPWSNMPSVFSHWRQTIPSAHFHYLTTTPEPATRMYVEFVFGSYPLGSLDTRPYNFTTFDQTFRVRAVALRRALETFRQRKFVLMGDTANADVLRDYPQLAKEYGNVQASARPSTLDACLTRSLHSVHSHPQRIRDRWRGLPPVRHERFAGLDKSTYFFYRIPDDIMGLDIANGECVNKSVPQHIEYGWQNLLRNPDHTRNWNGRKA